MKYKYQSSLSRRLVASGLAAVFSAGAFSSYVGAMKETIDESMDEQLSEVLNGTQNKEETEVPTDIARVTIGSKTYEFKNIPSDQISSNFDKYIEKNKESVEEVLGLLKFLDNFCAEDCSKDFNINFFLDNVLFASENTDRCVKLREIFEDELVDTKELIKDFPKTFDILYFVVKDLSKSENLGDLDAVGFYSYLTTDYSGYDKVIIEHFGTFYKKVGPVIEAHFEQIIKKNQEFKEEREKFGQKEQEEKRQKKKRKKFLMFFSFFALFFAGSMVVYNYSNINKQKDKDSSKKEPIHKDQNSTGEIQNPAGENKDSKDQTHRTLIENNKSTNETQEYTHEDREHEKQGNTTNDSNKYPKTDNGFGAKNLKVILPVTLGGTAAVSSNVAAGVIKHFSNKNRQK